MTLLLVVLVLVVMVNCYFMAFLISDVTAYADRVEQEPGNVLWLGVISFFQFLLSTFGISDFAVGAAVYSKLKWVSAKKLPGTVNAAAAIPIAVMALIYITSIEVGFATLVVPIVAQVAGTYISPRFVVKMPARPIRVFLVVGMLVTVLRIAAESFGLFPSGGFGFFPAGGTATTLETGRLALLGCLCLVYGALNNVGIGCFAPIIATTYLLGLNPVAAFPIMVGACTFSIPMASVQFIRHDSYSRKVTVISAIGGTLGVLTAAFVVRDLPPFPIKWFVAVFLLFSAISMLGSALRGDADDAGHVPQVRGGGAKNSKKISVVGHLTGFFLALVLLCSVSLVCVIIRNFHAISSGYVGMSISEHNTRLSESVSAYLSEHERVLLSARAGAVHYMTEEPADLEGLRLYLEETSRVLEGQQVFLIDSDGTFVVHPEEEMAARGNFFDIFREAGFEKYRAEILSESAGRFSVTENDMTLFSSPIPSAGWFVVSVIPAEKIFAAVYDQIISLFLTPLPIILFMLLAFLIVMRRESSDKLAAERHTREKDYFIARMSHEIRTPMNAVIGMSELAQREYGSPRGLEYLAGIKSAGVSLLAIINDILDFSKIETGQLELDAAPYRTADMLNDVLAILRVQMGGKPVELAVEADPNLPRGMIGDAVRVKQVLLNLLSNAVKYTDEGRICLRVRASREADREDDTTWLSFEVEDSGIGIKPEDMPKLFGDFTRIDEKRNSSVEGTGLGLSIARRLCRAMGGDITAESEYGKGSTFTAVLTQAVGDWSPMESLAAVSAARDAGPERRISFSAPEAEVLVVDDFASNLVVTEGLLEPYGVRVTTCENGREAVELVRSRQFDLVLMDHMMPEMDGMEALRAIRALGEDFKGLPIAVLTAHAVSGMREMFLVGGFDDFISKPIDTEELDALLQRWIPTAKQRPAPDGGQGGPAVPISGAAKAELAAQRLDLLNHYRWHFANGMPANGEYYEKFTALAEAMAGDAPAREGEMLTELSAAGRRGDAETIRRLLPEAYTALAVGKARTPEDLTSEGLSSGRFKDALRRLGAALGGGSAEGADAVMEELRAMDDMSAPARELYIFLYDALLMGETEKAAGGLAMWMKLY